MGIVVTPSLEGLPPELAARLSHGAGTPFFRSLEWFQCLVEADVFAATDVRVFHPRERRWALMMRQRADGGLDSLANFYTPEFGASGEAPDAELTALMDALVEHGGHGVVELRNVKRGTLAGDALAAACARCRYPVLAAAQHVNRYEPVAGVTAQDYLRARSSRLRNTIRRGRNRLQREHGFEVVLVNGPRPDLERFIHAYEHVYAESWKPPERHPEFVPRLIRQCAELGLLRLGVLFVGERPVAAQLWILDGGVAHIYKLAHDPRFESYSVGSLLTARMFEQAIDDDRAELIDFGMGDERYKGDWVSHRRTIERLQLVDPRRPRGAARLLRHAAGRWGRRLGLINH